MAQHTCPDCRWLETRVEFDDGLNFACRRGHLPQGAPILGRTPCKDFGLSEEVLSAGRPKAKAAPRGAVRLTGPFLQDPDPDAFRAHNRDRKTLSPSPKIMDEHQAVKRFIKDGDYVGFELYGTVRCPLSIVREVIRQGKKRLRLLGQGHMDVDLLVDTMGNISGDLQITRGEIHIERDQKWVVRQ
jgi:hypothetical protein